MYTLVFKNGAPNSKAQAWLDQANSILAHVNDIAQAHVLELMTTGSAVYYGGEAGGSMRAASDMKVTDLDRAVADSIVNLVDHLFPADPIHRAIRKT